jgi:hypothetical protein
MNNGTYYYASAVLQFYHELQRKWNEHLIHV